MAYTFDEPRLGLLQIAGTDSGIVPPGNGTTAIPTPPNVLGQTVRAFDPTYGEGEFILLCGVAANIVGYLVTYNQLTGITTACPNTANLAQPVAVSMSANTDPLKFSYYQIAGAAVIKKTAVKVSPNVAVYISATPGRIFPTSTAGKEVLGARSINAATVASATSTVVVQIDRPHMQGAIT